MATINKTGKPNPTYYNLGRGKVLFGTPLSTSSGRPTHGYRHLGNATEFNVSIESETIEHQSSRQGIKVTDKEVLVSQKANLKITLDELQLENLALFLSGSAEELADTENAAKNGFAERQLSTDIKLGRYYDITDSQGRKAWGLDKDDLTVSVGTPGSSSAVVEASNYEIDEKMATIFFLSGAPDISDGDSITLTLVANAAAKAPNKVYALTESSVVGALKFLAENPVNPDALGVGEKKEYQFHQVSLKADGELALIGDDWSQMSLTGTAEKNETASPTSPTLTITTYDQA